VEVEAYLGPHNDPPDPAAHSHRGPTPRNLVLFGPPGFAYVYSIYGRYYCMNITCEVEGRAGCVLLRALEPVTGLEQMLNSASELQVRDDGFAAGRIMVTPRIGIRHAVEMPLRFALAGNECVSGSKSFNLKCAFVG
jgi:DNA-3-methyladenine glycosylase